MAVRSRLDGRGTPWLSGRLDDRQMVVAWCKGLVGLVTDIQTLKSLGKPSLSNVR